ncbi:MAG: hypothetical protein CO167_02555, partial [Candidatus Marinimicrobia bacterium CG_4_9_14_3_um_filter_48_9]
YHRERNKLTQRFTEQKEVIINDLNARAAEISIQVLYSQSGFQTIPLQNEKPISEKQYSKLTDVEKDQIAESIKKVQGFISESVREIAKIEQISLEALEEFNQAMAAAAVGPRIEHIKQKYSRHKVLKQYLDTVKADIVANIALFTLADEQPTSPVENDGQEGSSVPENPFIRYKVNVLVDNSQQKGGPVIIDTNPTYYNVFGRIEKRPVMGGIVTDF